MPEILSVLVPPAGSPTKIHLSITVPILPFPIPTLPKLPFTAPIPEIVNPLKVV